MSRSHFRIMSVILALGFISLNPCFALNGNSIEIDTDNSGNTTANQKPSLTPETPLQTPIAEEKNATLSQEAGDNSRPKSSSSNVSESKTATVDSISISDNADNSAEVKIQGENLKKPSVEKVKAQKIVIKFSKTELKIPSKLKEEDSIVKTVRSSSHGRTAWIVLDTTGVKSWSVQEGDSGYIIALVPVRTSVDKTVLKEGSSNTDLEANRISAEDSKSSARLIDFSLKPMERGVKIVLTSDGITKYTVRKLTRPEKLVIRFHGSRLEILDKDKKLKEAQTLQKLGLLMMELRQIGPRFSPTSEAILTLMPGTTHQVVKDLNQIVITLTAPFSAEKVVEKKGDINQLISLDLEGADLNAVIKTLASEAGFDVDFMGVSLMGNVNEKLKDVPLKTALGDLLSPGNYDYEVQGNLLRIGTQTIIKSSKIAMPQVVEIINPSSGMAADQFDALVRGILKPTNASVPAIDKTRNVIILKGTAGDIAEYKKTIKDLKLDESGSSDRITRVVNLNYSMPQSMVLMLKPYLTPVGNVQFDTRTNNLIIWDVASNMGVLLELIKEIDIRPPQVLIESNIVEVSNENDLNLGVNWNANSTNGDPILTGAVNLPPTSALALPGAFTFGTIKSGFNVSATLNALETKKHGKVISRPRIATASGVQANITTTQNVLFQTEQDTIGLGGVVTRNFLATTLPLPINLTVTPRITDDGRITTVVNIQVTSVSGPAVGALPPPTSIQTATTTITTKNGETIVIGGLVRDVAQDTTNGIPILSSLPIIGTLFQEKDKTISKEELVIFITPTLLED